MDMSGGTEAMLHQLGLERAQVETMFRERLGAVPTIRYLSDPALVWIVSSFIQKFAVSEVNELRQRIEARSQNAGYDKIRVLISNIALDGFAGSELWTLEMALFLNKSGVDVLVYSPTIGVVAKKFAAEGVAVTDRLDDVESFRPTVAHIHHAGETGAVLAKVPANCRVVNMIHGLLPHPEWPMDNADVYAAVSLHAKAKAAIFSPAAWEEIPLIPNFFNPERFPRRRRVQNGRALLHSSRISPASLERLRAIMADQGFTLDQIGYGGQVRDAPEAIIANYEIVFAAGRSAIEAMASGCAVVLWDDGVVGPAINRDNFWFALPTNFSVASGVLPYMMIDQEECPSWIGEQIAARDVTDETMLLVREHLSIDRAASQLLRLYSRGEG